MDAQANAPHDLSTLAWVREELGKSLDTAHKALRRCLKEVSAAAHSDVDAVDPAILRTARMHLHQGVGALELVGMPVGAIVLRASEAAVQRYAAKPHKLEPAAVETIERASFALIDYISRMLAGKSISPVALFPQYRAVKELTGSDRVHPADLWAHEWRWHELPVPEVVAVAADSRAVEQFERTLLGMMRRPRGELALRLGQQCAGLGVDSPSAAAATTWRMAHAFFEGMAHGCIPVEVYTKRVASGLLAQLRGQSRGSSDVSPRLAHDLLFFCAHAQADAAGQMPESLRQVRKVWGVEQQASINYLEHQLGRYDPAWVVQARKRVAGAKDAWSAVAGGDLHRLGTLGEQFALVGDSLQRLYPGGDWLAASLQQAMGATIQSASAPPPALAMEVATSVLYLEASLEDADFDHPQQGERVRRLADRIDAVRQGKPPEPLEPWMEELYRRVSDRQTLGSVVQELRTSLTEAEGQIDTYFRQPEDVAPLVKVPQLLQSMRGVLTVLGVDQGAQAVVHMRDDVDGLITPPEVPPGETGATGDNLSQAERFDRLARNLGALGFMIDMLGVQPQVAKSLFVWHADEGLLRPVMGRAESPRPLIGATPDAGPDAPRLIEQAYALAHAVEHDEPLDAVSSRLDQLAHESAVEQLPALAQAVASAQTAVEQAHMAPDDQAEEAQSMARKEVASAMASFVASASAPLPSAHGGLSVLSAVHANAPVTASGLEDDDEMREVFLEEAQEVFTQARAALAQLETQPSDQEELTVVRRAFHTLKGSSRMVGLNDFGEAAWSCEQLYNARLADAKPADRDLREFTAQALDYFAAWVDEIAQNQPVAHISAPVSAAANALRLDGEWIGVTGSPSRLDELSSSSAPQSLAPETTDEQDLSEAPALPAAASIATGADKPAVDFHFDLDAGEAAPAPAPAAPDSEFPATRFAATAFAGFAGSAFGTEASRDQPPSPEVPSQPEEARGSDSGSGSSTIDLPLTPSDATAFGSSMIETLHPTPAAIPPELDLPLDSIPGIDLEIDAVEAPPVEAPPVGAEATEPAEPAERVRSIGDLRISEPLFEIYLNEADERSGQLCQLVHEWSPQAGSEPPPDDLVVLAHSLAGSSATVGNIELSGLARSLEHALMRNQALGSATPDETQLFRDAADEIRALLHQFAAGILKAPDPALMARLAEHEDLSAARLEALSSLDAAPASDPMPLDMLAPEAPDSGFVPADLVDDDSVPASLTGPVSTTHAHGLDSPLTAMAPLGSLPVLAFDDLGDAPDTLLAGLGHMPAALHGDDLNASLADDIEAVDAVDPDLFPIFEEEGEDLLARLNQQMDHLRAAPTDNTPAMACMRTLHTFKGGARLAGAMRLGEMAHRLETALERQLSLSATPDEGRLNQLQAQVDALVTVFEGLRTRDAEAYARAELEARDAMLLAADDPLGRLAAPLPVEPAVSAPLPLVDLPAVAESGPAPDLAATETTQPEPQPRSEVAGVDWSRFSPAAQDAMRPTILLGSAAHSSVRVRPQLLDRMVNTAGEVSITRARLMSDVGMVRSSLGDLGDNLERLRNQVRDMELQAETQMSTRMEAARAAAEFDPLEFDRYTRFQELSRMVAESINDVATVQRTLQRTVESTEDSLASQSRLTRELQDDLLRTRMVEFESLTDRLYRVVRMAAKEVGKQVRMDIVGGQIEIDRSVLDRMTGAFEHLLRNCVVHGIETPKQREAAGKDHTGTVLISLHQEGNEVAIEVRDDGAGLDLKRIRERAIASGLMTAETERSDAELAQYIFQPGFTTATELTELAGRGVGMDVVRAEVNAIGGRIEIGSVAGQGSRFNMVLPLTTAVTQVVMLRCGPLTVGVPANLIELVRRAKPAEIDESYNTGSYTYGEQQLPFYWLGALLQSSPRGLEVNVRSLPVLIIRSAQQRVAIHVDEVLGNQEVVVKNLGPQLSGLPGLAGMSLLVSGSIALIYNPVALASIYGEAARRYSSGEGAAALANGSALPATAHGSPETPARPAAQDTAAAPLVLVVDDSLTVRRVTQRLLVREGFRVALAKDGLDALEKLALERPAVVLSDIEMPRMDGFDLLRNIRGDARWQDLPVVMITSRIAQKHRDYAEQLGANHYLGKPYSEEELLGLIRDYTRLGQTAVSVAPVTVH